MRTLLVGMCSHAKSAAERYLHVGVNITPQIKQPMPRCKNLQTARKRNMMNTHLPLLSCWCCSGCAVILASVAPLWYPVLLGAPGPGCRYCVPTGEGGRVPDQLGTHAQALSAGAAACSGCVLHNCAWERPGALRHAIIQQSYTASFSHFSHARGAPGTPAKIKRSAQQPPAPSAGGAPLLPKAGTVDFNNRAAQHEHLLFSCGAVLDHG